MTYNQDHPRTTAAALAGRFAAKLCRTSDYDGTSTIGPPPHTRKPKRMNLRCTQINADKKRTSKQRLNLDPILFEGNLYTPMELGSSKAQERLLTNSGDDELRDVSDGLGP